MGAASRWSPRYRPNSLPINEPSQVGQELSIKCGSISALLANVVVERHCSSKWHWWVGGAQTFSRAWPVDSFDSWRCTKVCRCRSTEKFRLNELESACSHHCVALNPSKYLKARTILAASWWPNFDLFGVFLWNGRANWQADRTSWWLVNWLRLRRFTCGSMTDPGESLHLSFCGQRSIGGRWLAR